MFPSIRQRYRLQEDGLRRRAPRRGRLRLPRRGHLRGGREDATSSREGLLKAGMVEDLVWISGDWTPWHVYSIILLFDCVMFKCSLSRFFGRVLYSKKGK